MPIHKLEKRIEQYLGILQEHAYNVVPSTHFTSWSYASTQETFGEKVPELPQKPLCFPFSYGKGWTNWWFSTVLDLTGLTGEVFLELLLGTDAMVFMDGSPEGAVNPFHRLFRVTPFLGDKHTIHIESWDGHMFPGFHPGEKGRVLTTIAVPQKAYPLIFPEPRLLVRDESTYELYYDVLTLYRTCQTIDRESFQYRMILATLHDTLMTIDIEGSEEQKRQQQIEQARTLLAPLLLAHNGTFAPQVLSVGNAHIDHAWLWPLSETVRKVARTSLNMVGFSRIDPTFRFLFSQPAQMEAVRQVYPSVFAKVKEAFRQGAWEPNGVTYIEPDCILTGGESLIRQCLFGRQLTADLFDGYFGDVCWLPDSFGFSAALPQILKGCGVEYFVTSKLSWNDTERFPYDICFWEGVDGTRIPCHMVQGAYEGTNDPRDVAKAYGSIVHKEFQPIVFRSIGEGDGGGGTMESDIAFMKREYDLQGLPRNHWTTLSQAMHTIFDNPKDLPIYRGELYLELHRGTYTNQAHLKQYNRMLEHLLHASEYLVSIAFTQKKDWRPQTDILRQAWKTVLVNQFHDILPGSSIQKVNKEAEATYRKTLDLVKSVFPTCENTDLVLNPGCFPFPLPDGTAIAPYHCAGRPQVLPTHPCTNGTYVLDWGTVSIDADGTIDSVVLSDGDRQLVGIGQRMNRLTLGEDYPIAWDAWDIEADSKEKAMNIGSPSFQESNEDADAYHMHQGWDAVGNGSQIQQEIVLFKHQCRIDFRTSVSWHESHRLLRVEFPTTIRTDHARFDEAFCFVDRSTLRNTLHEQARFEVPAHSWAALGDSELWLAIATDSKYGYAAEDGMLSVSLLRATKAPDPCADQGEHCFTYSFLASSKGLGPIMAHAQALCTPLIPMERTVDPLCTVTRSSVVVETVKVAENGQGLLFRLREPYGIPQQAEVTFPSFLDGTGLRCTDMLEREKTVKEPFAFHPFEVKSYFVPLA